MGRRKDSPVSRGTLAGRRGGRPVRAQARREAASAGPATSGVRKRSTARFATDLRSSSFRVLWSARTIAFLFGIGLTFGTLGYIRVLQSIFGPAPQMRLLVLGVVFACGAAGPWVARRAAMLLVHVWAATVRGAFPKSSRPVSARIGAEHVAADGLPWLLQSMLGMLLGVLLLGGLMCSPAVRYAWAALSTSFYWTPASEWVCLCALTAAVVGLTGMAAGLQLVALYSATSRTRGVTTRAAPGSFRETHITAGVLLGIAAGLTLYRLSGESALSAERWVLLAAVPMFGISVLSVLVARWTEESAGENDTAPGRRAAGGPDKMPDGELRGLILMSAVAWGLATGLWITSMGSLVEAPAGPSHRSMGWMLAAMAVGAWVAGWPPGRRKYSMSGYGLALWAGGAAIMATVTLAPRGNGHALAALGVSLAAFATAACLGHASPYGRRALVGRCVSERQGLAQWVAATLCGLIAGASAHHGLGGAGSSGIVSMTAACLLLLIVGGLLLIHERAGARHLRQQRVALVFASLALAVFVLPAAARRAPAEWREQAQATTTPAVTAGRTPPDGESRPRFVETLLSDFDWVAPGAQIAGIGDIAVVAPPSAWRIDHVVWNREAAAAHAARGANDAVSLRGPPRLHKDVDTWWRRGRTHHDLIVQTAAGMRPPEVPARLSWEWFEGLRRRLLPKGTLLVELPLAHMDVAAVESAAQTFAAVFETHERWLLVVGTDAALGAYLIATHESSGLPVGPAAAFRRLSSGAWVWSRQLFVTEEERRAIPVNTIRAPAFRSARNTLAPDTAMLRWMLVRGQTALRKGNPDADGPENGRTLPP